MSIFSPDSNQDSKSWHSDQDLKSLTQKARLEMSDTVTKTWKVPHSNQDLKSSLQ